MPDRGEIPTGSPKQTRPSSVSAQLWGTLTTIQQMKDRVRTPNLTVDDIADIDDPVPLNKVVSDSDQKRGAWREITVTFRAYGVGQAQPPWSDEDEPLWLVVGTFEDGGRTSWFPIDGDSVSVQTGVRINVNRLMARSLRLSGDRVSRVFCEASAFEEDWAGSIVDSLIDAAENDINGLITTGSSAVPAVALFETPAAAQRALQKIISKAARSRDGVGGDVNVIDSGMRRWWRADGAAERWTCRKWTLHTSPSVRDKSDETLDEDDNAAWYLAEWIVELAGDPVPEPPPVVDPRTRGGDGRGTTDGTTDGTDSEGRNTGDEANREDTPPERQGSVGGSEDAETSARSGIEQGDESAREPLPRRVEFEAPRRVETPIIDERLIGPEVSKPDLRRSVPLTFSRPTNIRLIPKPGGEANAIIDPDSIERIDLLDDDF